MVFRNTLAALLATACDALGFAWGVRFGQWDTGLATAFGAVLGGIVNYIINRLWTFGSQQRWLAEMLRYGWVSLAAAAISSIWVHLWAFHAPAASPWLIWIVVKCSVSWGLSLPLQRFYVFGGRRT